MLISASIPYEFVDVSGFDESGEDGAGTPRSTLLAVNSLARVPTVVFRDGTILTESAALVLHLSDLRPAAFLGPPPGHMLRPAFLDRLVWLVANVYPTFTRADYPHRFSPASPDEVRDTARAERRNLWLAWEALLRENEWALGGRRTALDLYVAVMANWNPGLGWFEGHCPKLAGIAKRCYLDPVLAPVWSRNFQGR